MEGQQVRQAKTTEAVLQRETSTALKLPESARVPLHPLLKLQRQIGNRAVTQMLQAKLTVGKPNDVYEQEADRVADTVMRMPDPLIHRQPEEKEEIAQTKPLVGPISPLVQRQEEDKEETAQTKSLIGSGKTIVQRQASEEKKDETAQMLQRQETEEKKDEQVQTLQRQATEEKKDEQAQMLQRQASEEKDEEQAQTLQRQADEEQDEQAQAKGSVDAAPEVSSGLESSIQAMRGGGQPLSEPTRAFFESRFGYDLSGVQVHTGANASEAARKLNAEAFTIKQDIFFNDGRYEPQTHRGKWLLAHELTHTVQQQPQPLSVTQTKPSIQSSTVTPSHPLAFSSAIPQVQGAWVPGLDSLFEWVSDKAANIPGFSLLTFILGRNPLTDKPVERNATNLFRGVLGLVPGGELVFKILQETGALERAFTWLNDQLRQLNITWEGAKALFNQAWDAIKLKDGFEAALVKVKDIFNPTIQRITVFAKSVAGKVVQFVKEAILKPVGQFIKEKVRGYKLLTVILGKDPVTGEPVERNATNFIGGVLDLIPGGKETFKNLQESGAIDRATAWLDQQITRLNLTWEQIKALFQMAWNALSINDITSPSKAFEKIQTIFAPPIKRIGDFAVAVGKQVLEFIFEGVLKLAGPLAGAVMEVVKRSGEVFSKIIYDPIGFARNLMKGVEKGFQQFVDNIQEHLKGGLMAWLFGALATAGIVLPEKIDLESIVSLVLKVLGATYAHLRELLVKLIGEKNVAQVEEVFDFLGTLATKGLSAAWEKITEFVGSLADMVMNTVKDWVVTKVVASAVTKLISMLNPVGAVVQAIISVYNTIAFFMERAQQIAMLVGAVTQSITSIAAGAIGAAANFIEQSMAKAIPVILGFLTRFIGLGDVAEPIQKAIKGIQDKVWGAITKLAQFIIEKAKGLFGFGTNSSTKADNRSNEQKKSDVHKATQEAEQIIKESNATKQDIESKLPNIQSKYKLNSISLKKASDGKFYIEAKINPEEESQHYPLQSDEDLDKARINFGQILFTAQEFADLKSINRVAAVSHLEKWCKESKVFILKGRTYKDCFTPFDLYSFNENKADFKNYSSKRNKYGYINPKKKSPIGLEILSKGLTNPPPSGKTLDLKYHQKKAVYKSMRPGSTKQFGWAKAILGHDDSKLGASDHWNELGHRQTDIQNIDWNQKPDHYWGPEEATESSSSGTKSPLYRIPAKWFDSNPMWWQ